MRYVRKCAFLLLVSSLLFGAKAKIEDPGKNKLLLEIITYVLKRGHYNSKEIDDAFSENVYKSYLEKIDGQHRYFLKSDINYFNRFQHSIDDQINAAQLDFFNITYDRLMKRMKIVEGFYEELLEKPFDFSKEETISSDYDNLPYAASISELKKMWRKVFKFNVLQTYVSKKEEEQSKLKKDSTYTIKPDIELEIDARDALKEDMKNTFNAYNDLEKEDWFSAYINSIVMQFDPHTYYFAPSAKENFDTSMSGTFEGIGARLQKKNQQVKIIEIISGGPVWRDKLLEVGDIILKVAQKGEEAVSVSEMRLDDAVKLIKGPKGTQVFLTVKRVDGTIEEVVVIRDVVELKGTYAKSSIITDNDKIFGLIELPKFYVNPRGYNERNAASDVKNEIEQLKSRNIEGLILDLRNNGGGSLKTAVEIAGFFIPRGPIVQVKGAGGKKQALKDEDPKVYWHGPLVILVNEFSASASEIVSAALQDYKRAIVLGSKQTFGKGTVQNIVNLNHIVSKSTYDDLGALKITTDMFYRVNGQSTQLKGIKSDVVFPDQYAYVEMGERDQDNALAWNKITPSVYIPWNKMINYEYSIERSRERLQNSPLIKIIDQQAHWIKKQQDDNDSPLNYQKYKEELQLDEEYVKRFDVLSEFESPYTFKWLEEAGIGKSTDSDYVEERNRWAEGLKKDFYIAEAVSILKDLNTNVGSLPKIAQTKK